MKWTERMKQKKVWIPVISFLVAVGLLSASQAECIKDVLTTIF